MGSEMSRSDPFSEYSSKICACDGRMKCCDSNAEEKSDSTNKRFIRAPEGFRYAGRVKRADSTGQLLPRSPESSEQSRDHRLSDDSQQKIDGILVATKPASKVENRRASRLFQCRESEQFSWIEVPKPLRGWSEIEQKFVIDAMKEHSKFNKDPAELEKLILKATTKIPLKTHEECVQCIRHLEASRVVYFSNNN